MLYSYYSSYLKLLNLFCYNYKLITYLTGELRIQASRGLLLRLYYTLLYYSLERCTLHLFRL